MKEIKLTQGRFAQIDDDDFEFINQFNWCAFGTNNLWYAVRGVNKKLVMMHRIIINANDGVEVDHVDHNGLNNQKSNLRICNHTQNCMNGKARGRSKYIGVSYLRDKFFQAYICPNGKKIHLGTFRNEIDAAKIRDIAAIKHFGEFANLNFK